MPLAGCVAVGQSANMYTQNYGSTRETSTLNLPPLYSENPFPDGVNRNAFLGSWVRASSSAFLR